MTTTPRNVISSAGSRRALLGRPAAGAALCFITILAPGATRAAAPSLATGSAPQTVRCISGDTVVAGNLYRPAGYPGDSAHPDGSSLLAQAREVRHAVHD
jgi:hypothetical protein